MVAVRCYMLCHGNRFIVDDSILKILLLLLVVVKTSVMMFLGIIITLYA
jgi:hypothetical protein